MKKAIIIFTRVPAAGATKTRLMPFLSGEECAGLHRNFIKDTYCCCRECKEDILVFYTPEDQKGFLKQIMDDSDMFFPQYGEDLGERMRHAFAVAFHLGYEACVLVGTDIPQMRPRIVEAAFQGLLENDIVINPTVDGGYYLIGMTEEQDSIWQVKQYGTNTVIHNTLRCLKESHLRTAVGEVCRDIDTAEDLYHLYKELKGIDKPACCYTWNYMKNELSHKWSEEYGTSECAKVRTL